MNLTMLPDLAMTLATTEYDREVAKRAWMKYDNLPDEQWDRVEDDRLFDAYLVMIARYEAARDKVLLVMGLKPEKLNNED